MKQRWTIDSVSSLEETTIIVTGGNSGVGYESIKAFAQKNANIIMASRSLERGKKAMEKLRNDGLAEKVHLMQLDLASKASIETFSKAFLKKYKKLDILLNNAGIMAVPYATTQDGFESQIGTNHLGHFYLTGLLIDCLIKTPHSRIINVSSLAHRFGEIDFDNFLFEGKKGYTPFRAYGRSKLCNLLFSHELQKRFSIKGIAVSALAAHPGFAKTNLANNLKEATIFFKGLMFFLNLTKIMQSQDMGALSLIRASVDEYAVGGEYYGPGGVLELTGYPKPVRAKKKASDDIISSKLWKVSEELTGIRYLT